MEAEENLIKRLPKGSGRHRGKSKSLVSRNKGPKQLNSPDTCIHQCRYNYLRITSELVTIKWNEDDRMFTVSGTYGK